eukprot:Skav224958  [mRNA]  locus=scaffold1186:428792:442362:+ [translate_table: standard]
MTNMGHDQRYTLIVWVFNPPTSTLAATWRMDTFSRFSAEPDTALDETEFTGYNVNNMLNIFEVTNTNNVLNGNTKVNDVDIWLQFPDPMKDGDEILITGPRDFNLIGNPELANCNESVAHRGGAGVAHMKGSVVKSSHIFQGWSVNPQLESVDLRLVGTQFAAGKISDIEVKFTPITDADTLKIEALLDGFRVQAIFPTQFNFDQSTAGP